MILSSIPVPRDMRGTDTYAPGPLDLGFIPIGRDMMRAGCDKPSHWARRVNWEKH
jgi:hypothetical protein